MIGDKGRPGHFAAVSVDDHQKLTALEVQLANVLICLDSTSDTIASLCHISACLLHAQNTSPNRKGFLLEILERPVVSIAFVKAGREVQYTRKKAEALLAKISNTRELVSGL
jgi:hypothetical protein